MLFLERSGYREETYHTFSYSPLADDSGAIVGMLCVVAEETERVIGERRMSTLNGLASSLSATQHEPDVLVAVSEALGANGRDLPFTLTYLIEGDERAARVRDGRERGRHGGAAPAVAERGEHDGGLARVAAARREHRRARPGRRRWARLAGERRLGRAGQERDDGETAGARPQRAGRLSRRRAQPSPRRSTPRAQHSSS